MSDTTTLPDWASEPEPVEEYSPREPRPSQNILESLIMASPDPDEERARVNGSVELGRTLRVDPAYVYRNHDQVVSQYWGRPMTPTSNWDAIQNSWRIGEIQVALGRIGRKLWLNPNDEALFEEYEALLATLPPEDEIKRSFPMPFLKAMAEQIPFMGQIAASGVQRGIEGAMAGATAAAIGGQLGPQALAPEELFTFPVAAIAGYGVGQKAGSIAEAITITSGMIMGDLLQMEDAAGNRIDRNLARAAAAGGGIISGLLETAQVSRVISGNAVLARATNRAISNVLKKMHIEGTAGRIIANFAGEYFGNVTTEITQEVLQESVEFAAAEIAKELSNELNGTLINRATADDYLDLVQETIKQSALGFSGLGLPGSVYAGIQQTQQQQQYIDDIRRDLEDLQGQPRTAEEAEAMVSAIERARSARPDDYSVERRENTYRVRSQDGTSMATIEVRESQDGGIELSSTEIIQTSPAALQRAISEIRTQNPLAPIRFDETTREGRALQRAVEDQSPDLRVLNAAGDMQRDYVQSIEDERNAILLRMEDERQMAAGEQRDPILEDLEAQYQDLQDDYDFAAARLDDLESQKAIYAPVEYREAWQQRSHDYMFQKEAFDAGQQREWYAGPSSWQYRLRIERALPQFSSEMVDRGLQLLQFRAESAGVDPNEYMRATFTEDMFSSLIESEQEISAIATERGYDPLTVKGAARFIDDGRAIIHATKSADFSTFVHELSHVFRRQLTPEQQASAAEALAVSDVSWNEEQEESWARMFEGYVLRGEVADARLKPLFERMSNWMRRVYRGLQADQINLNPRIVSVFETLLKPGQGWVPPAAVTDSALRAGAQNNPNIFFQTDSNDITRDLVYKTTEIVNTKMKGPMPGRQILAMLRGAGVKADELRWTGLDEYLDTDRKITPIALQHYVEEHRVQIDVVKKTQGDVQYGLYVLPNKSGGNYIPANDAYIDYPTDGEYIEHIFRLNTPDGGVWFESGHFGENVLAHARTTERFTVPATDSVYMVEEIQSDWHQAGRDSGYSSTKEDALEAEAIPEAPLSKTWHEFVFRRMLKEAIAGGYDYIAWTTGEQQNERYGLDGTGMVDFYDKKLVKYAKKIANEAGSSVEALQINALINTYTETDLSDRAPGVDVFAALQAEIGQATAVVHGMRITDQMRGQKKYDTLFQTARPDIEKIRSYADSYLKNHKKPGLSSIDLIENPAKLNNISEAGFLFNERAAKFWKKKGLDPNNPSDRDAVNQVMADTLAYEVMYAIAKDPSAVGWYDHIVDKTMEIMEGKHPELSSSELDRMIFTLAIAVTSQGNNVFDNFRYGEVAYEAFKREGVLPDEFEWGGESLDQMRNNFDKLNDLLIELGPGRMIDFLQSEFTVGELRRLGFEVSQELVDFKVRGFMLLGPKIGSFAGNLNKLFDSVTMDLWFTRTMNRIAGTMFSWSESAIRGGASKSGGLVRLRNAIQESADLTAEEQSLYMKEIDALLSLPEGELTIEEFVNTAVGERTFEWRNAYSASHNDFSKEALLGTKKKFGGLPALRKFLESDQQVFKSPEGLIADIDAAVPDIEAGLSYFEFVEKYNALFNALKKKEAKDVYGRTSTGTYAHKTQLFEAAKPVANQASVAGDPGAGSRRMEMRDITARLQAILQENNIELSNADLQAVLWYLEKDIYSSLGVSNSVAEKADYSDAARAVVDPEAFRGVVDETTARNLTAELTAGVSARRRDALRDRPAYPGRTKDGNLDRAGGPARKGDLGGPWDNRGPGFTSVEGLRAPVDLERVHYIPLRSNAQGKLLGLTRPRWVAEDRVKTYESIKKRATRAWLVSNETALYLAAGMSSRSMQFDEMIFELDNDAKSSNLYRDLLIESAASHPFGASVEIKDAEKYDNMRLFVTADGSAMLALTRDGDVVSVSSNQQLRLNDKGKPERSPIGQLMILAIQQGARKLDCFNTVLPRYYQQFGFRPVAKTVWNPEFAPEGWDENLYRMFQDGRPDVVTMVWDGGDRPTIHKRLGQFEEIKAADIPYSNDPWVEQARALQEIESGSPVYALMQRGDQEAAIQKAIHSGKFVPDEILSDYRDRPWAKRERKYRQERRERAEKLSWLYEEAKNASTFDSFAGYVLETYTDDLSDTIGDGDLEAFLKDVWDNASSKDVNTGNRKWSAGVDREYIESLLKEISRRKVEAQDAGLDHQALFLNAAALEKAGALTDKQIASLRKLLTGNATEYRQAIAAFYGDNDAVRQVQQEIEVGKARGVTDSTERVGDVSEIIEDLSRVMDYPTWQRIAAGDMTAEEIGALAEKSANELERAKGREQALRRERLEFGVASTEARVSAYKEGVLERRRLEQRARDIKKLKEHRDKVVRGIMRTVPRTVSADYRKLIEAIQWGIDPHTRSKKTLEKRERSLAFFRDHKAEADALPERAKRALGKKSLNEFTDAELDQLYEHIKHLTVIGRNKKRIRDELFQSATHRAATEVAQQILKNRVGAVREEGAPIIRDPRSNREKAEAIIYTTRRPQQLIDLLDGGAATYDGPAYRHIYRAMNEATDTELAQRFEREGAVTSRLNELGISVSDLAETRLHIRGVAVSLDQAIDVYAKMQNDLSAKALLGPEMFTTAEINEIVGSLSFEERALADFIIDEYEQHADRLWEAALDVDNIAPDRQDRYTSMWRRGVEFDTIKGQLLDELMMRKHIKKAAPEAGMLINRKTIPMEYQKPLSLGLLQHWQADIARQEHYINSARTIKRIRGILSHEAVKAAVRSNRNQALLGEIGRVVDRFANPHAFKQFHNDRWVDVLRSNAALAFLSFNAVTILKQAPSMALYSGYASASELAVALSDISTVSGWEKHRAFVEESDPQMRARSVDRAIDEIDAATFAKWKKAIGKIGMAGIMAMDKYITTAGWLASYRHAQNAGMSEREAIAYAQDVTLRTQPAGAPKDTAGIFTDERLYLFTQFSNQLNQIWNAATYTVPRAIQHGHAAQGLQMLIGLSMSALLIWILANRDIPDSPEDVEEILGGQFVNMIPVAGPILASFASGFGYSVPGAFTPFEAIGKGIGAAGQVLSGQDLTDSQWRYLALDMIEGAGVAYGMPAIITTRAIKGAQRGSLLEYMIFGGELGGRDGRLGGK